MRQGQAGVQSTLFQVLSLQENHRVTLGKMDIPRSFHRRPAGTGKALYGGSNPEGCRITC